MNIIKTITVLIMATIFVSGTALAEGKKLSEKLANTAIAFSINVQACDADAAILCPGLPLNSKKSFMCLMAYEDNLSLACELGIVEAALNLEMGMLAIDYSIASCEADADKYCLDVKPGEGRSVSCLRKNESKLETGCISALKETGFWNLGTK